MGEEFQEKTEKATPKKKEKAKEKGQVARDKDLSSMITMAGIGSILYFGGKFLLIELADMTGGILSMSYGTDPFVVSKIALIRGGYILAPFFLSSVVLGTLANVTQGGFIFKPLKFEISKIDPIQGMKKIFSTKGLIELLKSLLKFSVGSYLVYFIMKKDMDVLPTLSAMEVQDIMTVSGGLIMKALITAFCFYLVLAIISAILGKLQHDKSLKMTKQEIKEEHKESDGDPIIKSRIRSAQREAARKRMMQEVPTATVVITNPTHLAVAIKYSENDMSAPKIVAKGAGLVAAKIREIATEHGVPIIEDKPIARSLFKLELNSIIPEDLYIAVARILAYIYKLKGKI